MNRLVLILIALCLSVNMMAQKMTTPELEFVMQLRVTLGEAISVGETAHGNRQAIPITGGTFEGPRLKGTILSGGADYQLNNNDKQRTDVEAIYFIRTDDGVTIHVRNCGIIGQSEGKFVFYTTPKFEAPYDSKYAWLNNNVFVCRVGDEWPQGMVVLNVWKLRDPIKQ